MKRIEYFTGEDGAQLRAESWGSHVRILAFGAASSGQAQLSEAEAVRLRDWIDAWLEGRRAERRLAAPIESDVAERWGEDLARDQAEAGVAVDSDAAIGVAERELGRALSSTERRYLVMGYESKLGRVWPDR